MQVTCIPCKQVYYNWESGFRVISCKPTKDYGEKLDLTSYGTFSISGNNLMCITLGDELTVELEKDENSKYAASYHVFGSAGFIIEQQRIIVKEEQELAILKQLMTARQAKSVHSSYPNFIQMIMDGREDEIDTKKIKYVGKSYFGSYVKKLSAERDRLRLLPVAATFGITNLNEIAKLSNIFHDKIELGAAFKENPYRVLCKHLGYPFRRADKVILPRRPEFRVSKQRCEFAAYDVLKNNELEGNTRMSASQMARVVNDFAPELICKIVETVNECPEIYYNQSSKQCALQATYDNEKIIADNILSRLKHPQLTPMDWGKFKIIDGLGCTDEQAEILRLACEQSVMMLCGQAGSGKSTVMRALVRMLEYNNLSYSILAPTGIASKRISQTTGRMAYTVHKFLAMQMPFGDFLILEESSMLGVNLLGSLFYNLPKSTKIIFICDNAQLASISAGNIVQNIIDSKIVPTAQLTKVFRYGIGGIATVSTDTRNGKKFEPSEYPDYRFISAQENVIEQIISAYDDLIVSGYSANDIMVLCPYNKTNVGTYAINTAIQKKYNAHPETTATYRKDGYNIMFKVGDKVANTENNYHMSAVVMNDCGEYEEMDEDGEHYTISVMNGDIGYVREVQTHKDAPWLIVEFDSGFGLFKPEDIKNLLLGYSLSIHRVQGAETKAVIAVVCKEHATMATRNLLYVALSRAKEKLIEIGDVDVINHALNIQENKERDTFLKDMLLNGGENDEKV